MWVDWSELEAALLRHFYAARAPPSGGLGDYPTIRTTSRPFVTQVAAGRRGKLAAFGGQCPTIDCTGVRDGIHAMDLSRGTP